MAAIRQSVRSCLLLALVSVSSLAVLPSPALAVAQPPPRIFIVHSYHPDLTWTAGVAAGIRETFAQEKVEVTINSDYLDARRYPNLRARTADLVEERLRGFAPDLVIACDNDALNFVVARRGGRLPRVPIVFCGVNSFHPGLLAGQSRITGILEDASIVETVRAALRFHPDTRRLVVVGRTRIPADLANREAFESALPHLGESLEVVFWDDLPVAELRGRLAGLPSGTIVFINGLLQDEGGREMMYDQTTAFIRANSRVPLYSLWDVYLGHGIVGGKLVSASKQGELAAAITIRILRGEDVDTIPAVGAQEANQFMFDARELDRFHISRSQLPPGSILVHDAVSVWREYGWMILGVAVFGLAQSFIIFGLIVAIRLRRRAQRALAEQGERLGLALAGADLGTWDWDIPTGRLTVNERWAGMLGYRLEELEPHVRTWEALLHPDDAPLSLAAIQAHFAGEIPSVEMEERLRHKSGGWVWVLDKGKVITWDAAGKPCRMCGTHLDITDRKSAEGQRLEMERRLQHSQKLESLGVLAGGIAHDFNNLLMAILGNLELAEMSLPQGSSVRVRVGEAAAAGRRAADLTRQMLAYSGRGHFVVQEVNLSALVDEFANLLRTSISKTAALDLRLAREIPLIRADSAQLQQVVMNLITNASEAIGTGTGTISVTTGVQDCDEAYLAHTWLDEKPPAGLYVFLEVSDTGCGMDKETQRRLFEPFFTTKAAGRGLGISAVLGIVRGHRGAIMVQSEVGVGTTVKVLLPALPSAGRPETPDRQRSAEPPPAPTSRGGMVLVVDDEQEVRQVARLMVERLGFHAETAGDGAEALDWFRGHAAEVVFVLLDLTMPKLDGGTVFAEMRRIRPDVKVILSSGYDQQEVIRRFADQGLAGFVHKPCLFATLQAEVQRVLGTA